MSKVSTATSMGPLFKNVYPDDHVGKAKHDTDRSKRFRRIRKLINKQNK